MGKLFAQRTRLAKGSHASPQLQSLQVWGNSLAKGLLAGVRVDQADRHLEGGFPFWLALVMGPAFPAPADMAMATDVFEEGWLIVPACKHMSMYKMCTYAWHARYNQPRQHAAAHMCMRLHML